MMELTDTELDRLALHASVVFRDNQYNSDGISHLICELADDVITLITALKEAREEIARVQGLIDFQIEGEPYAYFTAWKERDAALAERDEARRDSEINAELRDAYCEKADRFERELDKALDEVSHFYDLAVDDPSKNPPLFWKARADTALAERDAAVEQGWKQDAHILSLQEENRTAIAERDEWRRCFIEALATAPKAPSAEALRDALEAARVHIKAETTLEPDNWDALETLSKIDTALAALKETDHGK